MKPNTPNITPISPQRLTYSLENFNRLQSYVTTLQKRLSEREEQLKNQTKSLNKFSPQLIPPEELVPVGKIRKDNVYSEELKMKWIGTGGGINVCMKAFLIRENENEVMNKFKNEISNMQRCIHPTFARVYGYSAKPDQGIVSIVREFVDGQSLSYLLFSKENMNLSWKFKWNLVQQIVTAVNFMHSRKMIHRDLTTECFKMSSKTNLKLVKFGDSKQFDSAEDDENEELISRTPGLASTWKAPETSGFDAKWSYKSDIFSLSFIFFEIAVQKKPVLPTLVSFDQEIVKGQRPPIPNNVHPCFRFIIESCWRTDPAQRPTTPQLMKYVFENANKFVNLD